ncbi:MAG: hypothetical protein EAZ78_14125 [Oscillatoriales cyanobacterium]|nr:MAG: hypothetical protein EA000_20210 [Oscillatoriales cyanobacterium]TAD94080.1 MAG: hypothetical protein EAZ98_20470 [Oscillatoriales cyanobacterium]TAE04666.1 MAG: hypothetical protein EAZ96_08230 [Oscillatoriales cyanobacterium]TAF02927.1 MAG: hypothetical protein EAZ78_14125 [Oscillatoriales cyanobacterium]TAF46271.1 MAG: hypothetical protein EAZ68_04040 [Oscillatoriales cyanobacterium]
MFLEISISYSVFKVQNFTENTGFCFSCPFHIYILHLYYAGVKGLGKVFLSGLGTGCISMSANIFVGAKHDRCKSLAIANKLSAVMLRLCKIGMLVDSTKEAGFFT